MARCMAGPGGERESLQPVRAPGRRLRGRGLAAAGGGRAQKTQGVEGHDASKRAQSVGVGGGHHPLLLRGQHAAHARRRGGCGGVRLHLPQPAALLQVHAASRGPGPQGAGGVGGGGAGGGAAGAAAARSARGGGGAERAVHGPAGHRRRRDGKAAGVCGAAQGNAAGAADVRHLHGDHQEEPGGAGLGELLVRGHGGGPAPDPGPLRDVRGTQDCPARDARVSERERAAGRGLPRDGGGAQRRRVHRQEPRAQHRRD
mmetsp:Transcript_30544/g.58830  ORF Transcript_30544/g.58830 Transcript_30544/m.58830 type:complete len:258 (+) Transcript_30544:316-1089(+)